MYTSSPLSATRNRYTSAQVKELDSASRLLNLVSLPQQLTTSVSLLFGNSGRDRRNRAFFQQRRLIAFINQEDIISLLDEKNGRIEHMEL